MEWGQAGAEAICPGADVAVIVDIVLFDDHARMAWANLVYVSNFVTVTHV